MKPHLKILIYIAAAILILFFLTAFSTAPVKP